MHGAQVSLNPYEFLCGRSLIGSLFGGVKRVLQENRISYWAPNIRYWDRMAPTSSPPLGTAHASSPAGNHYSWCCSWFWIYCVLLVMFACSTGASFGQVHIAWIELPRHKQSLRIASRRKEPPLHYMDGLLDWTAAYVVSCC